MTNEPTEELKQEKICFKFAPIVIPQKNPVTGQVTAAIQFITCQKENCTAWDFQKKTCRLIKSERSEI